MKLFKSKKADSGQEEHGFPFSLMIRIIFGGLLATFVLVIFIYKPGQILISNYYDQNAESTFDDVVDAITNEKPETSVNIDEDYNIYGFIKDKKLVVSWLRRTGFTEGDYYLNPCIKTNCICLYEKLLEEMKCVETPKPVIMREHIGISYFEFEPKLENNYPFELNNFKGDLTIEYDTDYIYIDKK